jgi:molybdate transport system regulatory protein
MKYGARNTIKVRVTEVKKGNIMSLAKFQTIGEAKMASVLTTESLEHLGLKPGDEVQLVIKAIHVLPVRE